MKKFKQTNGNIKNYNGIFEEKIQDKNHNEKSEDAKDKINMIELIGMMKINIEDEDYKKIYDCEEDDEIENGKDNSNVHIKDVANHSILIIFGISINLFI